MNTRTLIQLATLAGLLPLAGVAQNLVENGSFEDYTYCPDYWGQVAGNVTGWDVCANSPDFFHACRDSADLGVPFNWRGYQQAAHGQGYAGVITYQWNAPSYREFICTALAQPLLPGVPVSLSMNVALGGFGSYWLYSPRWTTKGIGMLLTTEPFEWSTGSLYPNTAQVYMDALFTDTTAWMPLSATYVPDSAYQYLTIGNFFEDSLSEVTLLDTVFGNQNIAYIYIDEVCITPTGMACDFAESLDAHSSDTWHIGTPFGEHLEITFGRALEERMELLLCAADGRTVARRMIAAGSLRNDWPVYGLANGFYVVCSTFQDKNFKPLRVLHVSP